MKKLFILFIILFTFSCSVENDTPRTTQEPLPIESALLPDEFVLGQTYEITLFYIRPTNCHAFNDIYYAQHLNERTVVLISTVYVENVPCSTVNAETEVSFNFQATEYGSYIFKFWQGLNESGDDTYLIYEVPVSE